MRNFIIYVAALLFPVFVGMACVNFIVDPGHIYSSNYIEKVVEGARRGLNVTNVSDMDERIFKKKLIESNKGKQFDYVVFGSSRVMTISGDCLKGKSVLNVGVSGSKLEDMIALYQICIENDITFKNVIIGADPTLFNANDMDTRWEAIGSYYYAYEGNEVGNAERRYKITLFKNLFSPSYFKNAIKNIPKFLAANEQIKYVKTYKNVGATKRPDGSIYYAKDYCEVPQSWIDNDAESCLHGSFSNFNSFSEDRKGLFEEFINSLHATGANIYIWCCPYHPLFYKRAMKMTGIPPSIKYIKTFAKNKGFTIIGSFNPKEVGLTNRDFHDGFHVRKEAVDQLILNCHEL